MPQFNALIGPELIEVILSKIRTILEETGEFSNHRAFPWIKLTIGEIKILAYPAQGKDDEPVIKIPAEEVVLSEPGAPQPDEQPIIVDLPASEDIIDTPDEARVDAGLAIPTPGLADAAGVPVPHLVDKLVMPVAEVKRGPGRPRKNA